MEKIALIQGGLGAERKISCLSGQAVARVLDNLQVSYEIVEADDHLPEKLLVLKPSAAFLAVHGQYAEDGTIQGLCEYLKIPYTGSGVLSSAACMNKCFFKDLITQYRIPTPDYQNWDLKNRDVANISPPANSCFPLVVKPAREGSSLGISICHTPANFQSAVEKAIQHDTKIVLESYVQGQELALSFLNGQFLTPIEIKPKSGFYDYKHKYTVGQTEYILPPRVSSDVVEQCKKNALKVIQLLRVHSYCRADFIVKDNIPLMTEINTLPGLTASSLFPKSAAYDGINFPTLIQTILQGASLEYEKNR